MEDSELNKRMFVEQRVANETKNTALAYVFWLFLGIVSAHRFYLGRPGTAILQIISIFLIVGIFWWLIDIVLIPGMVRDHQSKIRESLLKELASN